MNRQIKIAIIVLASVVITSLGIYASDLANGVQNQLSGLVGEALGPCGSGAVQFNLKGRALCVDIFEASAGAGCPNLEPVNQAQTKANLDTQTCEATSARGNTPWRFVSFNEAQQMCARSGKRLLENEEWYYVSLGLANPEECVISGRSEPLRTGESSCVTPLGVYDLVGNVWEWIDAEVVNGQYQDRALPASGYVSLVDTDGFVLETEASPVSEFGADYAWTANTGVRGVIRGGFYASQSDAGIFSVNASVPLDFRTTGVGFRCVRDL